MEVEIERLDIWSVVKVAFVLYAVVGLVIGIIYVITAMVFTGLLNYGLGARETFMSRTIATGLGVLMIPLLALLYGFLGALGGVIFGLVYNVVSKTIGGVKVRLKGEIRGAGSLGEV